LPLLEPKRYKGARGGRGSGKSHFFAEAVIEAHIMNPNHNTVCVREIQKSLKFSVKKLLEDKIEALGVSHLFEITLTEIRSINGKGVIIFQGLQDHTAESIKSLESFNLAWVEEAQSISKRSLELLLPTIRAEDSEVWFTWNPDQEDDPVELHFKEEGSDSTVVHVNYLDNPFLPDTLNAEAERHKRINPLTFDHVWLGGFNNLKESQVFKGKYEIKEFEIDNTYGEPLFGMDFGFSQDPTTAGDCFIKNDILYLRTEATKVGLELDDTARYVIDRVPKISEYVVRADSARPESISFLKRTGLPFIEGVKKGAGSIEDGVSFMKSFDKIIIHPECENTAQEFRLYSYKVDKSTGDILPVIEDKHNHHIDRIRYALEPMMRDNVINYEDLV